MENKESNSTINLEIKRAAQLSITEIGVGSLGHGFKIPLTGHVLSLNQLAFLLNAINKDQLPKSSVFEISGIAATLKSFSPAGRKLGPMLSIAMQGFLFWFGITVLGLNIFGQLFGAVLLVLWAFVQPFITLMIIYGLESSKLIDFYQARISNDYAFLAWSLFYAVIFIVLLKTLLAIFFVFYSVISRKELKIFSGNKFTATVLSQIPNEKQNNAFNAALKDLTKPLFLLSFVLMAIFVWQVDGTQSEKIWLLMRPLGTAFVLFYLLRSPWVANKFKDVAKNSKVFGRLYLKASLAMEIISKKNKN